MCRVYQGDIQVRGNHLAGMTLCRPFPLTPAFGAVQILYGRKELPNIGESSPEVYISVESILPPQQPREGTKTPKGADNTRNFYVVEIPDLSEPSFPQDIEAGEVLQKIQLAKQHVRAHVCRDSVSSCQA